MADLTKEQQEDVLLFQSLQQQLQILGMQKQQTDAQIAELNAAEEEVKKGEGTFFRYVGSVIVPKKKDELLKDLTEEKADLQARQANIDKQEQKVKTRFDSIRKKLEAQLKAQQAGGEGAELS